MIAESYLTFISEHWVELVGAFIGFLWVYLEYKASIWLWPVGIILPIFFIVISWQAKLYGGVVINSYYVLTSIYGWLVWLKGKKEASEELPISHISTLELWRTLLWAIPSYLIGVYALSRWTDAPYPWMDGLATILSFVGMIWLAGKRRQHWICWMVANTLNIALFCLAGDYISVSVFAVNLVVSIFGYRKWQVETNSHNL